MTEEKLKKDLRAAIVFLSARVDFFKTKLAEDKACYDGRRETLINARSVYRSEIEKVLHSKPKSKRAIERKEEDIERLERNISRIDADLANSQTKYEPSKLLISQLADVESELSKVQFRFENFDIEQERKLKDQMWEKRGIKERNTLIEEVWSRKNGEPEAKSARVPYKLGDRQCARKGEFCKPNCVFARARVFFLLRFGGRFIMEILVRKKFVKIWQH